MKFTQASRREMDSVAEDFPGQMGFYVEDILSGEYHQHKANSRYPTASVCKVPVMIELFRQSVEGRIRLDQRQRLGSHISHHGTGTLKMLKDDPELTLYDYARLMIGVSDNMATDTVMESVGLQNVNATMDELGYPNTRTSMTMSQWHYTIAGLQHLDQTADNNDYVHKRLVEGHLDHGGIGYTDSVGSNVTTPREIASIIKRLYLGDIVSASASEAMIELLKGCSDRSRIPLHLSSSTLVAHKIGSSTRIKADVGIVYLSTGPMVVSGMTLADDGQNDPGEAAIAEIVRLAIKGVSAESK